jgi:hypothetical protein
MKPDSMKPQNIVKDEISSIRKMQTCKLKKTISKKKVYGKKNLILWRKCGEGGHVLKMRWPLLIATHNLQT